jgi:Ca2+-binding RTX toxin-like protein
MAISSIFDPSTGVLTTAGDDLDNAITTSRNAAGTILVNGGAVPIQGGTATVANTGLVSVFGQGGNDTIALDESNGALPAAFLVGGDGNDVMTGGSGGDQLIGGVGNDLLLGKGGNDFIQGGDGNDVLTGGDGDDQVFGGAGNDRMIWNPGDDTDLFEGGDGTDTAEVNGGNGAEVFTITANGGRVRFDRVSPAPFSIDIGTTENLVVNMNGGDDVITAGNGLSPLIQLTIDGGAGNDTITGGDGNDVLLGGDGDDVITGGRGNDAALLAAGNDTFIWNPGDGNDTVEGQDGVDALLFNGANINENVTISANGSRVNFFRDVANVTMDLNGVEGIVFRALGGADNIVINDVSGTDLALSGVAIDLGAAGGGGDGSADTVTVNGRAGNDNINISAANGTVLVTGSPTTVAINNAEAANDRLIINGGGGDDTFSATGNLAALIGLTVDGGAGNDTILGGNGADLLLGGDGNDFIDGNQGNDVALLGAGDDVFQWDPGDGSDVVEGQAGLDRLDFNGNGANENFDISANGGRVLLTRNVGSIVMDVNDVEGIIVRAGGGTDNITINDVSGTDLALSGVAVDLAGVLGSAVGDGAADTVTVNGRAGNDAINVSLVNGVILTTGSPSTVAIFNAEAANDRLIVNGGDGNDVINASALPAGAIALQLNGGAGNDTLTGSAGNDVLFGGDGDDVLTGGPGDDQLFGEAGNDRMIWNQGDGTDLNEGGDGIDTAEVNGGNGGETFTVTANGTRVRFDRLSPAPFSLDIGTTENLVVNMNGGDDSFSATGNLAALISVTVDGGAGNDTILGGNGADLLIGGDGNDFIDGNQGNDTAFLGAGDDVFQWDPGDGSDTVEGQAGLDRLDFNGSGTNENFDISANGERVRLTRSVGNIVMDVNDVEGIIVRALGGADNVVINDVSGTDLALSGVAVDLAGVLGSAIGDGAADTVTVNGRAGNDAINVSLVNGVIFTTGSPSTVAIFNAEAANDRLIVNGGGGDDTINASALAANAIGLTIDGGAGNDVITGSQGADLLLGGDGDDAVAGGRGDDVVLLGAGNDVFGWNPGDGSDTVEGQDGLDGLIFNGANVNENIDISANGGRVRFFRDVANVTMDLNDVEGIRFEALGGVDNIVINDVTGTDLPGAGIVVDLEGALGSGVGDGVVDTVTVNATAGADAITVNAVNGMIKIAGAPAPVFIAHADATDQLVINGGAGDDVIDASALPAGQIGLTLNGGLGADVLIGSQGNDLVVGGDGDDVALLGAGNDTFVWNPGDDNDTIEGQAGVDALDFRGANLNENIDISANGSRVRFTRDVANVTMDTNGVEGIIFHAFGGVDKITINDVSGTNLALSGVAVDLEGSLGSGVGDGEGDQVTVNGRAGNDNINISTVNGVIFTTGSPATVAIFHADAGDELHVNGNAGDDSINASGLTAGAIALAIDGGDGNDGILGSQSDDAIVGGNGNDTLLGAQGNDVISGGAGNDVLIGGSGIDTLLGEAGQDTFLFTGTSLATLDTGVGTNRDLILDFSGDILDLQQIDANLNAAGDQAFSFIGTNAFSAAGQVRFFADGAGNTIVEGNVDNNLGADFQIELNAFTAQLQAGNFVL